ncbi:SlyX family protein [Pseudomonadales bacterium]|nr:SlyX family protein [Pseudomonadales bacterium]
MTTIANNTEQRIAELETRLEFQDETITELNDEMVLLQKRLYHQEKRLKMLSEKLQSQGQEEEGAEPQIEPPPPHY